MLGSFGDFWGEAVVSFWPLVPTICQATPSVVSFFPTSLPVKRAWAMMTRFFSVRGNQGIFDPAIKGCR